uniref:Uncharacterized protein n=1 Tax=Acrobeloides nanus TaxID=290746 RepID=A0A914DJZ7_9BILA
MNNGQYLDGQGLSADNTDNHETTRLVRGQVGQLMGWTRLVRGQDGHR